MQKLNKGFINTSLLVCGCTPKDKAHMNILHKDLTEQGIELFILSAKPETTVDFKTYDQLQDLPKIPDCAYILSDRDKTSEILQNVVDLGIKKILFYSSACFSLEDEMKCKQMQIETRCGCPILFSDVLPCRIHAFLGGYK